MQQIADAALLALSFGTAGVVAIPGKLSKVLSGADKLGNLQSIYSEMKREGRSNEEILLALGREVAVITATKLFGKTMGKWVDKQLRKIGVGEVRARYVGDGVGVSTTGTLKELIK